MALLWSDRGEVQARASLRQVLTGLRKDLGEDAMAALRITDDAVSLDPDRVVVEKANPGDELLAGFHLHDPAFEEWLRDERLRLEEETAPGGQSAPLTLPDKPSVAVLPFVNLSGDPEQEYFSDGITEDIITELSRFRSLFVIARNSSFAYKGRNVKIQEISKDLGVHYLAEGSVRKAGKRVRVTAQLIDGITGSHLWAERYDRDLEDIFAVQDDVAQTIAATVMGRLEGEGAARAKRKPTDNLNAYDCLMRGREHLYLFTPEDNPLARKMFEKAIALAPKYASAHAGLAETYWCDWFSGWTSDPEITFERFAQSAERSLALDDTDNRVHIEMGEVYLGRRQYDLAKHHFDKAVALNPSDSDARMHLGFYAIHVGNHDNAIIRIREATRLNPFGRYGYALGMALYLSGRYDEAIAAFKTVRARFSHIHAWLAASYAQKGKCDDAQQSVARFEMIVRSDMPIASERTSRDWSEFFAERFPFERPSDLDHLFDGLRKAGLLGQP